MLGLGLGLDSGLVVRIGVVNCVICFVDVPIRVRLRVVVGVSVPL